MVYGTNLHKFLEAAVETPESKLRRGIDDIFSVLTVKWSAADQQIRGLLGADGVVDEMALFFPTKDLMFVFISKAVQRDWVLFNQDDDVVETTPIQSSYDVEYWFLQHPDLPYRLELMLVLDGYSPYHGMLRQACEQLSMPAVLAHASFKTQSEEAYANAVRALRSAGYEVAQHCTSSYGRFSYFIGDPNEDLVALKPRINLRDSEAS